MKKLSIIRTAILSGTILSLVTYVQAADSLTTGFGSLKNLIDTFTTGVVKSLAGLFMALALIAFFWGIVQYIWAKRSGDGKGAMDGNKFMQSGLIALFVMFSVYGIVKFAQTTLMPNTTFDTITIPDINFGGKGSSAQGAANGASGAQPSSPGAVNGVDSAQPSSSGAVTAGVTEITPANGPIGWRYFSDGTSIGPDGAYYQGSTQITGAGGSAVTTQDCSKYKTSSTCQSPCVWESMGSAGGTCYASD